MKEGYEIMNKFSITALLKKIESHTCQTIQTKHYEELQHFLDKITQ